MLRLDRQRRLALGETLRELANISAGALVLGQFVGQQPVSAGAMVTGVAVWLVLVVTALWLDGGRTRG